MLRDTDFKKLTIAFTNKEGEQVTLKTPAFFCDSEAMPMLMETSEYYIVYGYTVDDESLRCDRDEWISWNMGQGSGIQLIERRNHSAVELYSDAMPASEQDEDRFFIGGLEKPRGVRPRYNELGKKLKLDLYDEGYYLGGDSYTVLIAGEAYDASDLLAAECDDSSAEEPHYVIDHDRWDEESMAALLYIITGTEFDSMEDFVSRISKGVTWLDVFDVVIDTTLFNCDAYIRNECIQLPKWAYKWLSCYEHSGCSYFEQGDSVHASDRWDTSPLVGVWFLSQERIAELQQLEQEEGIEARNAAVYEQYKRDMKFISDDNVAYAIKSVWFSKDNPAVVDETQQEMDCIFWDELTSDNIATWLQDVSTSVKGAEPVQYEIITASIKDPYAYR